jgi:ABC-2 type transport system ATP-binding protein
MIEVRGLTKRYGLGAGIENLDLEVQPGEVVALVGPNGAGKSTALRAVAGQILPDAGQILIAGIDLSRDPLAAKARLGYLPQEPVLYPYLTGEEFLRFVARVRGVTDIEAALALCDLGPASRRITREYSFGMQKRLALAGALLGDPAVLLFDEVFAGLDPLVAARVAERLRAEAARGAAVLLSGHELATVAEVADRVAVLAQARLRRLLYSGEIRALQGEPGALERAFREIVAESSTAAPG